MTVEEAGALLGISRGLDYELVRRGELPSLRLGRRLVVPIQRLQSMLDGDGVTGDLAASPAAGAAGREQSDSEARSVLGRRDRSA